MVEIIDILYDLRIKVGQKHIEIERFHWLHANKKNLNIEEKKELIKIDDKHKIHSKLNEVFIKNHINIWNEWINLNNKEDNYYIIEVDKNKTSSIISFDSYDIAESTYFIKFQENKDSHFVLTKIEKPNFKRICTAYASYVLIKHDYLDDWTSITSNIIDDLIEKEDQKELVFFSKHIEDNVVEQLALIEGELKVVEEFRKDDQFNYQGWFEWVQELRSRLDKIKSISLGESTSNEKTKNFFTKLLGIK